MGVLQRGAALVLLGVLAALTVATQPANAAPQIGFSFPGGFVDRRAVEGPQPGPLERIRADAVRRVASSSDTVKVGVGWLSVQRDCRAIRNGTFDWGLTDKLMVVSHEADVRLMFILRSPPSCASVGRKQGLEPRGRYRASFAKFVRKIVERYGAGGKFFDRYGDDYPKAKPVRLLEIWNEPNLKKKWSTKDPKDFGRFMVQVSESVRDANNWNRRIKVIHGGLAGLYAERWLRGLYPLRRFNQVVDGIGLHTYAESAAAALRIVAGTRKRMRAGRHRAPIYVTEHAWATCPEPSRTYRRGKCTTVPLQAAKLRDYVELLRARKQRRLGVSMMLWYTSQDINDWEDAADCPKEPTHLFGLFRKNGDPKPSWDVWRDLQGLAPDPAPMPPNTMTSVKPGC